jgi:N-acetylglucosamine-6-phosphate deacetylase
MKKAVQDIDEAKKCVQGNLLGAHLEGPYLSEKQCGAQCTDFITPPQKEEYESLIEEYGGSIARWTYAPEKDKDGSFCKYLNAHGIVVSAGHTDATYADMQTAIENGCNLVTHLYSCTSTVTRKQGFRFLGVVETTYLRDELYAEIIADGKHLPPDLLKLIYKIKGAERICLITDAVFAGIPEGTVTKFTGNDIIIEDGVAKLLDRSAFAGSVAYCDLLVRNMIQLADVPLEDAVYMMTATPARQVGLTTKGSVASGMDADLVIFDDDVNVDMNIIGGEVVYSKI